jgi:hypothetical protein
LIRDLADLQLIHESMRGNSIIPLPGHNFEPPISDPIHIAGPFPTTVARLLANM